MWRPQSVTTTSNDEKSNFTTSYLDVYRQSGGQLVQANRAQENVNPQCQIPDQSRRIMWPIAQSQSSEFNLNPPSSSSSTLQWPSSSSSDYADYPDTLTPDQDGDLPIHIAVAKEDLNQMISILQIMRQYNHPIDVLNNLRQTPLHLSVMTQNESSVRLLLSHGASPTVADRGGNSSIHLAARIGAKECLRHLLDSLLSENSINAHNFEGFAPLHLAVFGQNVDIIKALVCRNADVDVVDGKSGRTPLFNAIEYSNEGIVELLLSLGASVNLANYSGITPLIVATDRGNKNITSMLISRGAMINSRDDS